ncbi:MAG: hypothetical protein ACOC7V_06850 [Spirochaetota bacterium]
MNKQSMMPAPALLAVLLMILTGGLARAQDPEETTAQGATSGPSAPEETDIVVPELVLEVEEIEVEQVRAVLPDEGELALGQVSIPLPGADELAIDDGAFAVPLPGSPAAADAASIFSSGRLGAGSANHIVGELSLYKLGADPRFRLRFAYEGLDGFQFRAPGTGYFSRSNVIDGWFAASGQRVDLDAEAAFRENAFGLQGESDSFSSGLRRTSAAAQAVFTPEPLISLTGMFDGSVGSRILSTANGRDATGELEIAATPAAEARFTISAVDIVFESSYFIRALVSENVPVQQNVDLTGGVDVELPASMTLGARAGIFWEPGVPLDYPWRVSLGMLFGDAFEASLEGGYRVQRITMEGIWDRIPLAGVSSGEAVSELANDRQWYAALDTRWSGASGLSLTGEVDFAAHDAAVDIAAYDTFAEEFPLVQDPMLTLESGVRASWRPGQRMQVQAGWSGSFLDTPVGIPTSSIEGSLRVNDASERFTGVVEARSEFYPQAAMPWLGITGSFAPSDELEFSLELADVLAPILENGRGTLGPVPTDDHPFVQPGFRASVYTRISL